MKKPGEKHKPQKTPLESLRGRTDLAEIFTDSGFPIQRSIYGYIGWLCSATELTPEFHGDRYDQSLSPTDINKAK
jgi:hypothetical protein